MTILTILLVIIIFGFLVFVHEFGHFWAAKRAGVEVEEFGFGFPPKIIGKKFRGTEYTINALPLGGFVKMKGESLVDTASGTFGATSFWQKTKILFAGVVMNALTAFVIIFVLCLTGLPPIINDQYSSGSPSFAQPKQVMAVIVDTGSPAAAAGIKRGDMILKANGQPLMSEQDLIDFTKNHAGQPVTFELAHHGDHRQAQVELRDVGATNGFLGVTPLQTYKLRYDPLHALVTAVGITLQLMWLTLSAFAGLVSGLFVHGHVSGNVTGPVGIVVLLKNILDLGVGYVLVFVASISVSLAVINALPLPALDGGRWAMALAARIRGRNLSQRLETAVHATGFALLILLMLVVTFFDIKRFG